MKLMKIVSAVVLLLAISGCQKMKTSVLGSEYDTQAAIADDIDSHM